MGQVFIRSLMANPSPSDASSKYLVCHKFEDGVRHIGSMTEPCQRAHGLVGEGVVSPRCPNTCARYLIVSGELKPVYPQSGHGLLNKKCIPIACNH